MGNSLCKSCQIGKALPHQAWMWESPAVIWWFLGVLGWSWVHSTSWKSQKMTHLKQKTLHFLPERLNQIERVVHLEFWDRMYPNVTYPRVQSPHFLHNCHERLSLACYLQNYSCCRAFGYVLKSPRIAWKMLEVSIMPRWPGNSPNGDWFHF